jgi:hypothetical protein
MSPTSLDWLHRLVEQLSSSLAAIERARQAGRLEEALQLIRQAARTGLGMDYESLTSTGVLSTAELLSHPVRVQALARLVAQEAAVLRALGQEALAEERIERAHMLEEEALRLSHGEVRAP